MTQKKTPIAFEADALSAQPKKDGDLKSVSDLATKLLRLEDRIERGIELLKELNAERHEIASRQLPELMDSFGMKEFTLNSGQKVVVKPITRASLPSASAIAKEKDSDARHDLEARFSKGIAYLEANNAGAIIKTHIEAELGKDAKALALKAQQALTKLGVGSDVSTSVHPSTLTSWVKERLAAGLPVDLEIFAVYTGSEAEIVQPKTKK